MLVAFPQAADSETCIDSTGSFTAVRSQLDQAASSIRTLAATQEASERATVALREEVLSLKAELRSSVAKQLQLGKQYSEQSTELAAAQRKLVSPVHMATRFLGLILFLV